MLQNLLHQCCIIVYIKVIRLKPDQPNQWLRAWIGTVLWDINKLYGFCLIAWFADQRMLEELIQHNLISR